MKIISFVNKKGGVGKTTLSINVAAVLAEQGNKVLVIDNDSQANATASLVDTDNKLGLYNVLVEDLDIKEVIHKTAIDNLDIAANNHAFVNTNNALQEEILKEFRLKDAIKNANLNYDYIIIDCNPSQDLVLINALMATDYIVMPVDDSFYSLEGINVLTNWFKKLYRANPNLKVAGIVLNHIDRRTNLHVEVANAIRENYPDLLFNQLIAQNSLFKKMAYDYKTVIDFKSNNAYKEISELVKEIEDRCQM